ncbi:hypothetical protein T01_5654 [Trichinella spiralis]|uniref:Uncharacterized protein n=1 Tax=Trichinella spiralis TaxID=6334 RepID=A0A0V1ASS7_TRISP|nr:hypothetical protein T01_5654 [Trichinella spiralis]
MTSELRATRFICNLQQKLHVQECYISHKRLSFNHITSVGRLPNRLDVRGGVGEDAQKWLLEVHKTQGLTNLASEA